MGLGHQRAPDDDRGILDADIFAIANLRLKFLIVQYLSYRVPHFGEYEVKNLDTCPPLTDVEQQDYLLSTSWKP
jgi:hypothetical protein